jgi:Na+-transporting methylmalonyl-CoA/oxaloacetate decarboxylase gamma subunit
MLKSPSDVLKKEDADWKEFIKPKPEDGLIIGGLKSVFRIPIWRTPYRKAVECLIRLCGCLETEYTTEPEARKPFVLASDWYMVGWTIILLVLYLTTFNSGSGWVWLTASILAAFRTLEIMSILVERHTIVGYPTPTPMRAVANTFWHYGEVIIAFAILHLTVSLAIEGSYTYTPSAVPGKSTVKFDAVLDPVYFSFVTITTLGYGDYLPTHWLGKSLVMGEVLIGLVLLVYVIQRAISTGLLKPGKEEVATSNKDCQNTGNPAG